ncbi:MAG: tRNA-dihydrouridine synthase [bacterium]
MPTSRLLRDLQSPNPTLIPAPLAGYTDHPFRKILRRNGCDHVFMAWVSSHGMDRNPEYLAKIKNDFADGDETNVQIFGYDPTLMAQAAEILAGIGAAQIDINMGCSVKKVWQAKTGSLLLTDLDNARAILKAVAGAVDVPVTLKTRIGWCSGGDEGLRLCLAAPYFGIAAVTLHARYAKQGFTGTANWEHIRFLKERLTIPVTANGDVTDGPTARACFEATGANGIMIGRAQMGNPWVFGEMKHYLATGTVAPEPSWEARIDTAIDHLQYMVDFYGDTQGTREFRKHLVKYLIGIPHSAAIKQRVLELLTSDDVFAVLREYRQRIVDFSPDTQPEPSPTPVVAELALP